MNNAATVIDLGVTKIKLNGIPRDPRVRHLALNNPIKYALLAGQNVNKINTNKNGEPETETPKQYVARKIRNADKFFIQDMFADYSDGQIHIDEGCEHEILALRRVKSRKVVVKNEKMHLVQNSYSLLGGGKCKISNSPKPFFAGR